MKKFLPVPGTWGYRDSWFLFGPWIDYLLARGFAAIRDEDGAPYRWSTRLAGLAGLLAKIPFLNRLRLVRDDKIDWEAGGDSLAYFMDDDVPYEDRNLIAHSWGGAVVAYGCRRRKIRALITIGTPWRKDLEDVWAAARPNIGYWLHVYDADDDKVSVGGSIGDGELGTNRRHPLANKNLPLKGIGHSGLLNDPKVFDLWVREGLLDVLAGHPAGAGA